MSVSRTRIAYLLCCFVLMACAQAGEADYDKGMDAFSEKRFSDAAQHLQKSADAGHLLGMATLASMLLKGQGVARNANQAAQWFEKAANRGHVDSQAILGLLYFNGIGVASDTAKARFWLTKAAGQGDKQSTWVLENLVERGVMRL
jgi:uncharacterized protein